MRRALTIVLLSIVTACHASGDSDASTSGAPAGAASEPGPSAPTPEITSPAIWLQGSASIDPKALPLRDQYYVTDAPKKGYVFVCDPRMFQQSS